MSAKPLPSTAVNIDAKVARMHDALYDKFELLAQFHVKIGSPNVVVGPEGIRQQFNEYVSAIVSELSEVQNEVPWKPWKDISLDDIKNLDRDKIAKELFDITVLVNSIGELFGIDASTFAVNGAQKYAELSVRASDGYYKTV